MRPLLPRLGPSRPALLAAAMAAAAAALQGCAQPPPPAPPPRVFAVDFQGAARLCTVPKGVNPAAGQGAEAQMVVVNDGGWCAIPVSRPGPMPYAAGLVAARPAHGQLNIHTVGNETRIDYTPDRGYAGPDSFAVRLIPGDAALRVAVTVQPGEPAVTPAAAAPAPAAPPPPSPPRARRR